MTAELPDSPVFVVVGSGLLARSVCQSLSAVVSFPLSVVIAARSASSVAEICQVCSVRAAAANNPVAFLPWRGSPFSDGAAEELLGTVRPRGVLLCASTQSPWEGAYRPSAWTRLLAESGIGLALPFHAEFAVRFGRAVAGQPGTFFLNGCFPDGVNPVLSALGVAVLAGIGNIAVLAAAAQAALGLPDQAELMLLGHHAHLREPDREGDEAIGWQRDVPLPVRQLLKAQRAVDRRETNHLTGHLSALLIRDLLGGRRVLTHLPGPDGLPGGYPVTIGADKVDLRLPPFVTVAQATEANQRWAWLDGVQLSAGQLTFAPRTACLLAGLLPDVAAGFAVSDIPEVMSMLSSLRAALRAQTDGGPTLKSERH